MFAKIQQTAYPPTFKPMMVWDGECGFCKYWVTNWKSKTGDRIDYRTFQEVSEQFKDIPLKEFKKASRLIELDGTVYSGPDSAFRTFEYFENPSHSFHHCYSNYKSFNLICDHAYNFIAKNRKFIFRLTKIFFGNDPEKIKPYWLLILLIVFAAIYFLLKFL